MADAGQTETLYIFGENISTSKLFLFISLPNQEIGFKFSVSVHLQHQLLNFILPGMLESLK